MYSPDRSKVIPYKNKPINNRNNNNLIIMPPLSPSYGGISVDMPEQINIFLKDCENKVLLVLNTVDLNSLLYYNYKVHGKNHVVDVSVLCSEGGKENV